MICIGGSHKDKPDNLILCAIDTISEVFTETCDLKNARKTANNNFFYFVKGHSFGFAKTQNIFLNSADQYDQGSNFNDKYRLSWLLTGGYGGWRLGVHTNLYIDNNHRKLILIRQLYDK